MLELANGGIFWAATMVSASTRPAACSSGAGSAGSGANRSNRRARASATERRESDALMRRDSFGNRRQNSVCISQLSGLPAAGFDHVGELLDPAAHPRPHFHIRDLQGGL